ncbi:uncharacterized protein BDW47DRAFT_109803, partial [Aspergillus candidus]
MISIGTSINIVAMAIVVFRGDIGIVVVVIFRGDIGKVNTLVITIVRGDIGIVAIGFGCSFSRLRSLFLRSRLFNLLSSLPFRLDISADVEISVSVRGGIVVRPLSLAQHLTAVSQVSTRRIGGHAALGVNCISGSPVRLMVDGV